MSELFRFVWTRRAVQKYRRTGSLEPSHTVSNMPADIASPWLDRDFDRRANGSDWLLVDENGHIAAGRENGRYWVARA